MGEEKNYVQKLKKLVGSFIIRFQLGDTINIKKTTFNNIIKEVYQ
jgi:hypothetical protein